MGTVVSTTDTQIAFLESLKAGDLAKSATCYTVGRHGDPTVGISLQLDRGPDELRPWEPFILLGEDFEEDFRIHRDYTKDDSGTPRGCIYHPNGKVGLLHRAALAKIEAGNRTFPVLRRPADDHDGVLLHVDLRIPHGGRLLSNGRPVRILTSAIAPDATVYYRDHRALVQLPKGGTVDLLFADGAVRRLCWKGESFVETKLSHAAMAASRVKDAEVRLKRATHISDVEHRRNMIKFILNCMADLISVPGVDVAAVEMILKDFFLADRENRLSPVHPKITAILHNTGRGALTKLIATPRTDKPKVFKKKTSGSPAPVKQVVDLSPLVDRFKVIEGGKSKKAADRKTERRARDRKRTMEEQARSAGGKKNK